MCKRLITPFDQRRNAEIVQPEQMARVMIGDVVPPISVRVKIEHNLSVIHIQWFIFFQSIFEAYEPQHVRNVSRKSREFAIDELIEDVDVGCKPQPCNCDAIIKRTFWVHV